MQGMIKPDASSLRNNFVVVPPVVSPQAVIISYRLNPLLFVPLHLPLFHVAVHLQKRRIKTIKLSAEVAIPGKAKPVNHTGSTFRRDMWFEDSKGSPLPC